MRRRVLRPRIAVVFVAALAIAGLCAYKLTRSHDARREQVILPAQKQLAPTFELYDQHKPQRRVRLAAYLGRHTILLVFFDGTRGADRSPILMRLRENYETLESTGIVVLSVSTALPQDNRKVIDRVGEFPFPLLSDPALEVHRQWGRVDGDEPLEGAFLIDRAGWVGWANGAPQPLDDPSETLDYLIFDP